MQQGRRYPEFFRQKVRKKFESIGIDEFGGDFDILVQQNLGLLSITGVTTPNWNITYHSLTGGNNFQVALSDGTVSIHGADPEPVSTVLELLFETSKYHGVDTQETIHLGSYSNLRFFNLDGSVKQQPKQLEG
jgi:hypothetical protein